MASSRYRIGVYLCAVFICFSLSSPLVAAPNGSELIPVGSWLYDALDILVAETGKSVTFTSRPFTVDEYHYHLRQLEQDSLSPAGRATLARIVRKLDEEVVFGDDTSAFDYALILAPELYLNSNPELIRDDASQHYLYEYNYGDEERQPIISIPLRFWAGPYLAAELQLSLKEQPGIGRYPVTIFPATGDPYVNSSNIPAAGTHILQHFPELYSLTFGDTSWNASLGSYARTLGMGRTGNLMLSKDAGPLNAASISWYNDYFRWNYAYISLMPGLDNNGTFDYANTNQRNLALAEFIQGYNIALYDVQGSDATNNDGYMDTGTYPYKGYLIHSMEFRLLKERLYLALTEAAVYSRCIPELRMLMPLYFWHSSSNSQQTNSLLSLDVQFALGKYVQLYASGVLDQFTMSHESGAEPEANGFLAGLIGRYPIGAGYVGVGMEYLYTSDWLYTHRFWLMTPTTLQHNVTVTRGGYNVRLLGYVRGNDCQLLHLETSYTQPGKFDVTLSYNNVVKGPYDVFLRKPWAPDIETVGDRINWPDAYEHQLALVGNYYPHEALALSLRTYFTHVRNYKNSPGAVFNNLEVTIGASVDPLHFFR